MRLVTIAVLLVGLTAGVLLRGWLGEDAHASTSVPAPARYDYPPPLPDNELIRLASRLDAHEREFTRLRAVDGGKPPTSADIGRVAARDSVELPLDRGAIFRQRDEQLAEFDREPIDTVWADEMRKQINEAFSPLVQSGAVHFTNTTECRTTKCVVRIMWPDLKTARAEYMSADLGSPDCARSMCVRLANGEKPEAWRSLEPRGVAFT